VPPDQLWSLTNEWGFCTYLSMSLLLAGYVLVNLTLLHFSKAHTFNKLTLLPQKMVFVASLLAVVWSYSIYFWSCDSGIREQIIYVSNMAKVSAINLAIAVQTFEWLLYGLMIRFQKKHRLETVIVEMRQFRGTEDTLWNMFNLTMSVLLSLTFIVWFILYVHSVLTYD
jgi:hypothetical protein